METVECLSSCPLRRNSSSCTDCDYSNPFAPTCGTSPTNPLCSCPHRAKLCNTTTPMDMGKGRFSAFPRAIALGETLVGSMSSDVLFAPFRLFLPAGFCKPLLISLRCKFGSLAGVNVLDIATAESIWTSLEFTPSQDTTICPDNPGYPSAGGTFFFVIAGQHELNAPVLSEYFVTVEALDVTPPTQPIPKPTIPHGIPTPTRLELLPATGRRKLTLRPRAARWTLPASVRRDAASERSQW